MSSPEMVAMQMQLQASADQVRMVSNALDLLRNESVAAVLDLRRLLAEARQVTKHDNRVSFVNAQTFEGGKFGGKLAEFKDWAKNVKIFSNSQCRGFKAAFELVENRSEPVSLPDESVPSGADVDKLARRSTTLSSRTRRMRP